MPDWLILQCADIKHIHQYVGEYNPSLHCVIPESVFVGLNIPPGQYESRGHKTHTDAPSGIYVPGAHCLVQSLISSCSVGLSPKL